MDGWKEGERGTDLRTQEQCGGLRSSQSPLWQTFISCRHFIPVSMFSLRLQMDIILGDMEMASTILFWQMVKRLLDNFSFPLFKG